MEVKINRDIKKYSEKIFFGMSVKQLVFSVLAAGASILAYFGLKDYLGTEPLSWVCVLVSAPFIFLGFFSYNGMGAGRFLLSVLKTFIYSKKRFTACGEGRRMRGGRNEADS